MFLKIGLTLTLLCVSFQNVYCTESECPNILSRSTWNAQRPLAITFLIIPLPYVVIHHSATPECNSTDECSTRIQNIQNYHMNDLGWDDIGYSFMVGGDGQIYEGNGWNKEGAHTYGYNKKSISIVFIGNFQNTDPPKEMVEAAHRLILCGKNQGMLRRTVRVIGARQVLSTASPGSRLYSKIRDWPEWTSNP